MFNSVSILSKLVSPVLSIQPSASTRLFFVAHHIHTSTAAMTKALVLGAYQVSGEQDSTSGNNTNVKKVLTDSAAHFDSQTEGKLKHLVDQFGPNKKGSAKKFYGLHADYPVVTVVGLGPQDAGYNESEEIDERRENIRCSIAIAAKSVRDEQGVDEVHFDACGDAEAVAEGAHLALFHFDELKSKKYKKKNVKVDLYRTPVVKDAEESFERGTRLANAQNVCRRLADLPSNYLTPTIFGKYVQDLFKDYPNVKVLVHDEQWAEAKKMGSFLSVGRGSVEPSKFVEVHYNNKPDSNPFVLVGKGVCFDSGGISIKPSGGMDKMRYDMSGAANVISTTLALASLDAKVNIVALAPLCENMPSGSATKPGDVVFAMNGKSIQVDNTDAEGRLILADALCYAHEFKPQAILDIATLTGAMKIALGAGAAGAFTHSKKLFEGLREAAVYTGDRVWRMPLYNLYKSQVTDSQLADVVNTSKVARPAGSCTAAAFLSEFVQCKEWVHLDIAGVMGAADEYPYYATGMSGRPMRTLFYFLTNYFKNS